MKKEYHKESTVEGKQIHECACQAINILKKPQRWVLSGLENVGSFTLKLMLFQSKNC